MIKVAKDLAAWREAQGLPLRPRSASQAAASIFLFPNRVEPDGQQDCEVRFWTETPSQGSVWTVCPQQKAGIRSARSVRI